MYFHFSRPGTALDGPEPMVDMFVRDITGGHCRHPESGGDPQVRHRRTGDHPGVERCCGRSRRPTVPPAFPITTTPAHTRRGLEQQRVFAEEGVGLSRVVIGHSGDTTDLDYLELIAAGSYLGMDRFGWTTSCPSEDRVDTVAGMCERGHAGKMVLAHDVVPHRLASGSRIAVRAAELAQLPDPIHNDVLPALQ